MMDRSKTTLALRRRGGVIGDMPAPAPPGLAGLLSGMTLPTSACDSTSTTPEKKISGADV
jgi:hypothetical protein